MQTTLLGLAIAFILALIAALIGPYFIDWNQFRPQFEAEATRVVGAPVRVGGTLEARLLPAPTLRLRSVSIGGPNDPGRARADKLDVEFSLSSLMRGEWRATELSIGGAALDFGLDAQGRIDLPTPSGRFNLGSLAIDRLNLTGRVAFHDAASRQTFELNDLRFSGDVRSLAGAMRGDGSVTLSGTQYPFRVSSGQTQDGNGTRVHVTIDPGERPLSIDLDGVLSFEARAPRFDGGLILARPAVSRPKPADDKPWRVTARVKADPAAARFEQIEASYGAEEAAVKLAGAGDARFGASPLLHVALSARQLDVDRLFVKDDSDKQPRRLLAELRTLIAAFPLAPLASQMEIAAEQITLGGRPVQTFGVDIAGDKTSWTIKRLDFRAPGMTRVGINGDLVQSGFTGLINIDSSDPDTFAAWLQGRNDVIYRNQKPLRAKGTLTIATDRIAIENLQTEIDGSPLAGRVAFVDRKAADGSRLDVELKGDRLDIDAAVALVRSLGGPQGEWPSSGQLSLDIGRAISAGQEMRPLIAQLGYGPKTISLDRFRIGDAGNLTLEGGGAFDRTDSTGSLNVSAVASSLSQITALMSPLAPAVATRLNAMPTMPGAVNIKLAMQLEKDREHADRANARVQVGLAGPQFNGNVTLSATPLLAVLRGLDMDALSRSEVAVESKLSSAKGSQLLALLGLDGALAGSDAALNFEGSATGIWRAPLRIKASLSGADLGATVQGMVEPWSEPPKAMLTVAVSHANLAPLFDLKSGDALAADISLSSRATLADGKLSFDDLDGTVAESRLRGRIALTTGSDKTIDGQIGLDTMALAPAFGFALGMRGRDASEPLGRGLLQGWRGQLAFQALRGVLPGGGELRPASGIIKSDGQSFSVDGLKGSIGGGEATLDIDARPGLAGLAVNARVQLSNVDGGALRYRVLAMPAGRSNLRMTLASQGRSAFALEGALSGSGLLTIDGARIAGLNPQAFEAAIRASDSGQATNDVKLRQIVEPVLSAGTLSVASAQIPFSIQSGRLRVSATALEADGGARAIVSGGYDIAADQADIRVNLISTAATTAPSTIVTRPELQVFAVGSPDRLDRTIDVASLSSWLAVRAIDRETRRLDSLERNEPPVILPTALPPAAAPPIAPQPAPIVVPVPRPAAIPPQPPAPQPSVPQVSQQVAPLPAPIEVRPAPGVVRVPRPRPAPPLVITPNVANPAR